MFGPWHSAVLLLLESCDVVGLRLMKLAGGGGTAIAESQLMVSEKISSAFEAGSSMMTGASTEQVIERYRAHVAANARRLAID